MLAGLFVSVVSLVVIAAPFGLAIGALRADRPRRRAAAFYFGLGVVALVWIGCTGLQLLAELESA